MDICPANWQLPRFEGHSSWLYLFREAYRFIEGGSNEDRESDSGYIAMAFPFSLPLSGVVSKDTGNTGEYTQAGFFWTSRRQNPLYIRRAYILPQNNNNGKHGFSVRCIAKQS
jgi:uncharacterized protein (TIGR02145 family)